MHFWTSHLSFFTLSLTSNKISTSANIDTTRPCQPVFGDRTSVRRQKRRREIIQPTFSPMGILYVPGLETPHGKARFEVRPSIKAATSKRGQSAQHCLFTLANTSESDTVPSLCARPTTLLTRFLWSRTFWDCFPVFLRIFAYFTVLHCTIRVFPGSGAVYYLLAHIVYGQVYFVEWFSSRSEQQGLDNTPPDVVLTLLAFYASELLWMIWNQATYVYLKLQE